MRASFVFSEVFTGLRRNVTMTVAMILTAAISLAMLGAGMIVMQSVELTKQNYLDDLQIAIFLNEDVSKNDKNCTQPTCEAIKQALEKHPAVSSQVFVNQDQAYEKAKQLFKDQPEITDAVSKNAFPASMQVQLKDPTRSDVLIRDFKDMPGVSRIHDDSQVVDKIVDGLNVFRNIAFIVAIVLLIAAILLISNMIQISAYTRRTEVGIMRLVGATRWYTQLPFLIEAMVAGLIGSVVAIAGLFGLQQVVPSTFAKQMDAVISFPGSAFTLLTVAPAMIAVSLIISAVVSYVTLRLYVRH